MNNSSWTPASVAETLVRAADTAQPRSSFAEEWPDFTEAEAYRAQDLALVIRRARGERVVGIKLGVTSRAKQRQVNVDTPNVAWLTDAMLLPAGEPVPAGELIHPRAEPEIAFRLGRTLRGPGVTAAEALAAVDRVFGAIEIIDSRFSGYAFTMTDVTADNASSGRFVTGPVHLPTDTLDLSLEAVLVGVDGEIVDSATGAAVYGHPAEALAFAANKLGERGHALEAGWIVLTGGMTDAVPMTPGRHVTAEFTHLGSVTVRA
ncbi:2-keto-4-pentenoate hydratase [Granulicoccus phenolivorans]|uniref:2-keto-4-pentenoate hydratase n=1 Tax=Granulicoccus phenolivorans TaxID=266854 RepID=UPI0004225103|nr:fumarylacetoacetate hydrolase family protein [Granulicoccus phenolivorans]